MIGRAIAAVLIGVGGAALFNAAFLFVTSGEPITSIAGLLAGILFAALIGMVMTVPAWLLFCLLALPVVTHRVRVGRRMLLRAYLAGAALIGAVLIITLFGAFGWRVPWQTPVMGMVGGLAIAAMWRLLVLDVIPPSAHDGAPLG